MGKGLAAGEYDITSAMSVYKNEVLESHQSISEIDKKIRMLYQEYKIHERYHTSIINRMCLDSIEYRIRQLKRLNSSLEKIVHEQCMHNLTHSVNLCILINTELRIFGKYFNKIHKYICRGGVKKNHMHISDSISLFHCDTITSNVNDVGVINASNKHKKKELRNMQFKFNKIMRFLTRALTTLKEDAKPHIKNASLVQFNDITTFIIERKVKMVRNCLFLYEKLGLKNTDLNQREDIKSSCVAKLSCALKALDQQNHMLLRLLLDCYSYPHELHLFKTAISAIDKGLNVNSQYLLEYSFDKLGEGDGCFVSSLKKTIFKKSHQYSFNSFINESSRLRSYISKDFCNEWQSAFIDFDDAFYLSAHLTIYDLYSANAPAYSFYLQACELLKQDTQINATLGILYKEYEMFIKILELIDERNKIKNHLEDENEMDEIIQYIRNMSWPEIEDVEETLNDGCTLGNKLCEGMAYEINCYEATKALYEYRRLLSE